MCFLRAMTQENILWMLSPISYHFDATHVQFHTFWWIIYKIVMHVCCFCLAKGERLPQIILGKVAFLEWRTQQLLWGLPQLYKASFFDFELNVGAIFTVLLEDLVVLLTKSSWTFQRISCISGTFFAIRMQYQKRNSSDIMFHIYNCPFLESIFSFITRNDSDSN